MNWVAISTKQKKIWWPWLPYLEANLPNSVAMATQFGSSYQTSGHSGEDGRTETILLYSQSIKYFELIILNLVIETQRL
jgi:hypothetical protein